MSDLPFSMFHNLFGTPRRESGSQHHLPTPSTSSAAAVKLLVAPGCAGGVDEGTMRPHMGAEDHRTWKASTQ